MRADIDAARQRRLDRPLHDERVAGVEAAGDVGGGQDVEQRLVVAHAPGAEAFAEVGIEIDVHGLAPSRGGSSSTSGSPKPTSAPSGATIARHDPVARREHRQQQRADPAAGPAPVRPTTGSSADQRRLVDSGWACRKSADT